MELVIILVIVLLLFGAGRLSSIGKGLGEGIRNFKKGIAGDDEPAPPAAPKQLAKQSAAQLPKKRAAAPVESDAPEDEDG